MICEVAVDQGTLLRPWSFTSRRESSKRRTTDTCDVRFSGWTPAGAWRPFSPAQRDVNTSTAKELPKAQGRFFARRPSRSCRRTSEPECIPVESQRSKHVCTVRPLPPTLHVHAILPLLIPVGNSF